MEMRSDPKDPNARARVWTAFLFLFVSIIAVSIGAYFVVDLGKLQQSIAARKDQTALQGITDPRQVDEALRQHPSNRLVQMVAMATRAASETNAAIEQLSGEVEPPSVSKTSNLGAASRSDLEALRQDLKTAEANTTTFMPRYVAVLKAERDNVQKYALSLHEGKDTISRFLANIDGRHAEIMTFNSRMLSARADFYRAYQNYVAVLIGEFGAYKVENGQFIFPFQRTVDRYNLAANAMKVASQRVAEVEATREDLQKAQQERWEKFVNGK